MFFVQRVFIYVCISITELQFCEREYYFKIIIKSFLNYGKNFKLRI